MTDDEQTPDTSQETKTVASEVSTQDVHTADDVSTGESKKTRGSIRPPAELYDEFLALKRGDESANDLLRRLIDASTDVDTLQGSIADLVSSNEHLQKVNVEIRETLEIEQHRHQTQFDDHVYEIGQLQARITTLENAAETAVVPAGGQASMDSFGSLGMKDIAEEIKEGCGGDETCTATVLKLQQTRIEAMSKHLDRDHGAEQKRLDREHDATQNDKDREEKDKDREERVKDRESKEKIATREQENKLEMQLMKKGILRKSFLEDAAFANIASIPKRPEEALKNKKKQAYREAEEEEEFGDDWDSAGGSDE